MKKISGIGKYLTVLLVMLLLLVALVSCGGEEPGTEPTEDNLELYDYSEISDGQTVSGEYSQFVNINILSSYLGYGYDVINEPYMSKNSINMSAPILDREKIKKASLMLIKENSSEFTSYKGSTMEEFAQKYSASLNVYGKSGKLFSGGLKADYKGSDQEKTFYSFYKSVYQVKSFNLYLTNSVAELRTMLSDEFLNDLNNMEPGVLFDKYGTHLIREVAMGGRIEVNTTYSSTTTGYTTEANAAVNAHIKYLKASLNLEAGATYNNECGKENIDEETEIKQFGGAFINTSSIEACSQNYDAWVRSFDQNLSNSALAGIVGENSLIGLWDLLDPADTARRQELENYFVESADESYAELCELFKLNNKRKVTVSIPDVDGAVPGKVEGNTSPYQRGDQVTLTAVPSAGFDFDGWYLGEEKLTADRVYTFAIDVDISLTAKFVKGEGLDGSGTSEDPYIITSREDFADISKNMSAYYKLANDIDFGLMSWTPISGVFTGYLDGNGHKLTNVKITRSASAVTSDVCLGLFEQIATTSAGGGYIYNLHIWNSSLNVSECHDGSGTIYAGLLCGINNGTIDNCTFLSDVVSVKRDKSNVGTIAGASLNRIVNCQLATISLSGNGNIGGVAGYLSSSAVVELCHVSSSGNGDSSIELIAVNSNRSAGGIAGLAEGCTIKNCTVDYTRFSLAGDMRLVPAMGVISGYQLGGYLTGNPNTIAAITKECTDSSYKTCFFGVSWGICGRGDYNPVIN